MKKNNRGITIIEMIVSMALISVVLGFLLGLLVQLKKIDDKSLKALEYENKIALITRYVQDRIAEDDSCSFTHNSNNQLKINCTDTGRNMTIVNATDSFTITDGSDTENYILPEGGKIGILHVNSSSSKYNIAQWKIKDDLDNVYTLEISYYKKSS